jgi:hypothetical protein
MGLTSVEAWDGGTIFKTSELTGESSRTGENEFGLERFKNDFYRKLKALKKLETWPVFGCAEVNAAYLLTVFKDTKLKDIRIKKAIDGHLLKDPCRNCSQWLELTDTPRVYKIKAEFLPPETKESESRVPKNGTSDGDPFPALPTSSKAVTK